jgi:ketosteroid isomerase-like protein
MTTLARRAAPSRPPISRRRNAAIVRSLYAAFSRLARSGEIASYVAAHFHPDCEYGPVEEASTIRGHEALIHWIERWLEAWDDAWDEIDEIIETGQTVVAAIRVHGRGRKSGMEISQRLFDVFELRDGRVVRVREYLSHDEALAAAGLSQYASPA